MLVTMLIALLVLFVMLVTVLFFALLLLLSITDCLPVLVTVCYHLAV